MKLMNLIESVKQKCVLKIYGAMAHKPNSKVSINNANKQSVKSVFILMLVGMVAIEPSIAVAGGGTDFGNLGAVAGNLIRFLTGAFGRSVATIAVIALGIMAMFGKLAWDTAIKVVVGIAVVFGAGALVDLISPPA